MKILAAALLLITGVASAQPPAKDEPASVVPPAANDPIASYFTALEATKLVLKRSGYSVNDIALWEINEAFASVPIAVCKDLGIDDEKVNIFGSGCSIGHPISASGARMINTLVYELQRRGGGLGVASMCAAAGQGGAVLIEV